jgi:hypothetical protein
VINNAASGVIQAADADASRPGTNATINNRGRIISHNGSASSTGNDAIDFRSGSTFGATTLYNGARSGVAMARPSRSPARSPTSSSTPARSKALSSWTAATIR